MIEREGFSGQGPGNPAGPARVRPPGRRALGCGPLAEAVLNHAEICLGGCRRTPQPEVYSPCVVIGHVQGGTGDVYSVA